MTGPFEKAMVAYSRGDYGAALLLLRPLGENGDVAAQSQLGFMYSKGLGVPRDDAEAATWVRRAALTFSLHPFLASRRLCTRPARTASKAALFGAHSCAPDCFGASKRHP